MTTYQFNVLNVKCGGCVNTIQTELSKINGVSNVIVSKDEGSVIVSGITLDPEYLRFKLHEIGYPEIGHNDFMSKAKSFITCTIEKF